ncbi:tyrosine-type recombinase/integrase [Actinoplanes xinjiangensis]|uniref:Phage integrase family protein n=1 Tax=Actinoplanes xinjiangensis TaxID=512350 RepID=A0A316FD13_9ACTN|nr:tyrosine-type recombinase/integrase [Actinoplanes xinjiangensis]PWK46303.1 phage integrase family protein [Actinoplanes xinjiangensis]GIF40759.1 hypothetical protein Axi01nite_50700 [Actinoplanes xinjiangensis]
MAKDTGKGAAGSRAAYRNAENRVFTKVDGSPLDPTQVYRVFRRLIKLHDMPDVPLHNLRHESASLLIEAGVDIAVVSKRLRHSKIGLTSDTYGHLVESVGKPPPKRRRPWFPGRQGSAGQDP